MDSDRLQRLLDDVAAGRVSADDAFARLRRLPYDDLGFAKVDLHRALRAGGPEAVYCPGKTPAQVVAILQRLIVDHVNVLATRADDAVVGAVAAAGLPHVWHAVARLIVARPERREGVGHGTSLNGLAALLAMLNSCAPGVSVVNVDNGYGAAHQASQINHLVAKIR